MTHFIDYTCNVSKQTFSAAVIIDSQGKQRGKIIIRFTDSQIGYNHHVGVIFHPAELNFSDTRKGSTYSQPGTLFKLLANNGIESYNFNNQLIVGYSKKQPKNTQMYDSMSRFDEIVKLKFNRKTYRVLWAM